MYSLNTEIKEIKLLRQIEPVISLHAIVEFPAHLGNFADYSARVFDIKGIITVSVQGQEPKHLGPLLVNNPSIRGTAGSKMSAYMPTYLSEWSLERIESLRAGGELYFSIHEARINGIIMIDGTNMNQQRVHEVEDVSLIATPPTIKFPKFDWVTDFDRVGLKKIRLFEFPIVEGNDIWNLVADIDLAWRKYQSGDYGDAITQCRKICETISTKLIELGFAKVDNDNKQSPDWKKLIGHDTYAENFTRLFSAVRGLSSPSAHAGAVIDKQLADLVLFNTHAVVNYIVKAVQKLPQT